MWTSPTTYPHASMCLSPVCRHWCSGARRRWRCSSITHRQLVLAHINTNPVLHDHPPRCPTCRPCSCKLCLGYEAVSDTVRHPAPGSVEDLISPTGCPTLRGYKFIPAAGFSFSSILRSAFPQYTRGLGVRFWHEVPYSGTLRLISRCVSNKFYVQTFVMRSDRYAGHIPPETCRRWF